MLCTETIWTLEDSQRITITMEKSVQTWWSCFLKGDAEIDTAKVESTKKIGEYDGSTQGTIRKIMFDQNQKMKGEANSDQILAAELMKDAW